MVAQTQQGPGQDRLWVQPRISGNNFGMIRSMLAFYLLNHDGPFIDVDEILSSGCWCHMNEETYGAHKGVPKDVLDLICRDWHRCEDCVGIDTSSSCEPLNQNYTVDIHTSEQRFYCSDSTNSPCELMACQCDVNLVTKLFESISQFDSALSSLNGFIAADECPPGPFGHASHVKDQCCGTYPERYPFSSMDNQRGCCNGKTFDHTMMECCADGELRSVGTCETCPCVHGDCTPFNGCVCHLGFHGPLCEEDTCSAHDHVRRSVDCGPNSSGMLPMVYGDPSTCYCECDTGYSGDHCEIGPCDTLPVSPCGYYGTCSVVTHNNAASYSCDCVDHWYGAQCENYDPCNHGPNPCENGGTCTDIGGNYVCSCPTGYSGDNCSEDICQPNPCGAGTCSSDANGYVCDCVATNNFGMACQYGYCSEIECGPFGTMSQVQNITNPVCVCICDPGYSGALCENLTPEDPTEVHDHCNTDSDCTAAGQYCYYGHCECNLAIGYIEDEFQPSDTYGECVGTISSCTTTSDCLYNQTCSLGYCICNVGVGDLCLKDGEWVCVEDPFPVDPCEENHGVTACGYYGQCNVVGTGLTATYSCTCDDHWSGANCEVYDHCNPNPCENGGVCRDIGNHFECNCINGYTGKLCDLSACDLNPCGEGICSETESGHDCDCTMTTYYGDNCDFNSCTDIDCGQNGQSEVLYNYETFSICGCVCDNGYAGSICEHPSPTPWGTDCATDSDCTTVGQYCNLDIGQCRCNYASGYVLDEFQASVTYGECVGPVSTCITSADCSHHQNCNMGFCNCDEGAGDLCIKDGIWECAHDPLSTVRFHVNIIEI